MKSLKLNRSDEESHTLISGDTGVGKSILIEQYLDYIERIGDIAVVLDSERSFVPTRFRQERGDWILNPKDERCPYWSIGEEGRDEAEFTAVVESLFPAPVGNTAEQGRIFHTWTVGLASFLLAEYKPTTAEFGDWMVNVQEIERRVKGSEHEHTLNKNAAPQYAGIVGTLNTAGKPLRMMPRQQGGRRKWSAMEWAENPSGWVFVTNTPDTEDALRPLQSMWLDLIILRRLSRDRKKGGPRVWIVLDELASLQALPRLHTAITRSRKTKNPIVIGVQNVADLEAIYGRRADTLVSQCYTKWLFATSHPQSAKMLSDLIGEVEYRKIRETRSGSLLGRQDRNSFSGPEDVRKPLILSSEVQNRENLRGYMLQRGVTVRFELPYKARPEIAPGLIERIIPPMQRVETKVELKTDQDFVGALTTAALERLMTAKKQGLGPECFEGPPITTFVCRQCYQIAEFDGVIEIPPSPCPKCGRDFYAAPGGDYAKVPIFQPRVKLTLAQASPASLPMPVS